MDGGTRAGRPPPAFQNSETVPPAWVWVGGRASKAPLVDPLGPQAARRASARRRGEELRRAGGAGPGVARSEVLYPPRFASGAGEVRTGRGGQARAIRGRGETLQLSVLSLD